MTLTYHSTRNKELRYTASQAILAGIAPDGGLFVPSEFPKLPIENMANQSYQEIALLVLKAWLTDFSEDELREAISVYGEKFDTPAVTPVVEEDGLHYLELFHGPTIAFKDMALSVLPKLMTTAAAKNTNENEIIILTATSGDTGKAALVGFSDVPNTRIIVFYPKNGVSDIQEKQMLTQKGDNVHVVAIEGNFDDAQSRVKELFADKDLQDELASRNQQFSSANSINIGRLIPQIVYYFYAYGQLVQENKIQNGGPITVTVPTGNFGNILAAYYAKQMGLPIKKLIVASNENNVLTDFFHTGSYDRMRDFILTSSPSMDILVSSNLERLLYHLVGEDTDQVAAFMQALKTEGHYQITKEMMASAAAFHADYALEEDVFAQIKNVYQKADYVIDPHTAVAARVAEKYQAETGDTTAMLVASTASPYKFPEAVLKAIQPDFKAENLEVLLNQLKHVTGIPFPAAIEEALNDPILHDTVVSIAEMKETVRSILNH